MCVYSFRNCLLNTIERVVIRDQHYVDMTTRTFDVLEFLIQNAGKLVTKDEILGTVWTGSIVEESNLPVHISKLRRLLAETKRNRFIETVQGVGYRFIAPVEIVSEEEWRAHSGTGSIFVAYPDVPKCDSVAIMPLKNETNDPHIQYVVDGLTESLINRVSRLKNLRVIARETIFRYQHKDVDIKDVGETLDVTKILTGRVRIIGNRVSVGVELINPEDRCQLWGRQYHENADDLFSAQERIVEAVAAALLTTNRSKDLLTESGTGTSTAYRFYLMGMHLLHKRTAFEVRKAIGYFQKSLDASPTEVKSLVGLITGHYFLYVIDRISREQALQSIEGPLTTLCALDQTSDEVQLLYAKLRLHLDWSLDAARHHVVAALTANPNSVEGYSLLADTMILSGEIEDALECVEHILRLDPISPRSLKCVGRMYYKIHHFENSVMILNDALEIESEDFEVLLLMGASYIELGEYRRALRLLNQSYKQHQSMEALAMIGYAEARAGRRDRSHRIIERIHQELKEHQGQAAHLARIHFALNEKEKGFRYLEEAYSNQALDIYALKIDPRWETVRNEPRFADFVNRVGIANELGRNEKSRSNIIDRLTCGGETPCSC